MGEITKEEVIKSKDEIIEALAELPLSEAIEVVDMIEEEYGEYVAEPFRAATERRGASVLDQVRASMQKPFLFSWKTSVGMFIMGLIASFALSAALGAVASLDTGTNGFIIIVGTCIAYVGLVFAYSLFIYPTLFTERPVLESSGAGSFLNSFTGGLIFGALWCTSLTKGKKGVSQYVFATLLALGLVAAILIGLGAIPGLSPSTLDGTPQQNASSNNASIDSASTSPSSKNAVTVSDNSPEKAAVGTTTIKDPASLASDEEAKRIIASGRKDPWNNLGGTVSEAYERITFGVMHASQDANKIRSWSVLSMAENAPIETLYQLEYVAIAEMLNDPEQARKVLDDTQVSLSHYTAYGNDDPAAIHVELSTQFTVDGQLYEGYLTFATDESSMSKVYEKSTFLEIANQKHKLSNDAGHTMDELGWPVFSELHVN